MNGVLGFGHQDRIEPVPPQEDAAVFREAIHKSEAP
jgi:hypothetical protein